MSNYPVKNVYVATDGISEKKFIRNSLIYLYSAKDAPESISEVKLSEVGQDLIQYGWQQNYFDISYDMEIGYHRQEQYLAEEKYYDSTLKQNRYRTVVKNRTVTDWQPYSNQRSNIRISSQRKLDIQSLKDVGDQTPEMKEKYGFGFYLDSPSTGSYKEVTGQEREMYINELTAAQCGELVSEAACNYNFLSSVRSTIPGDTYRNFHVDWKITDVDTDVYAVKRHKMAFDCPNGKGFIMQSEHGLEPTVYSNFRNTDDTVKILEEEKKKRIANDPMIVEKQEQKNKVVLPIYGGGAALVLLGLAFSFLLLLLGVGGLVGGYFYMRTTMDRPIEERKKQISAEYDAKIKTYVEGGIQSRIEKLNARLAEMGQPELTKKELRWFTDKDLEHTLGKETNDDDDEDEDEDEDDDEDEVNLDDDEDE